jgi:hypothetical protein
MVDLVNTTYWDKTRKMWVLIVDVDYNKNKVWAINVRELVENDLGNYNAFVVNLRNLVTLTETEWSDTIKYK